jgi:hypothetical protein
MRYSRRMSVESLSQDAPENGDGEGHGHAKGRSFAGWWESPRAIAVAAAIAAWLVPVPKHFSSDESARAKTKVCATYVSVRNAVSVGTPNPKPDDPVAQTAVAANVRLAMIGGSSFLRETVAAEPAASGDLTKAITSLASTLDQLGCAYLLRTGEGIKTPLLQKLNTEITQINQLCAPSKK